MKAITTLSHHHYSTDPEAGVSFQASWQDWSASISAAAAKLNGESIERETDRNRRRKKERNVRKQKSNEPEANYKNKFIRNSLKKGLLSDSHGVLSTCNVAADSR
jgi:hypothetical protein